MDENLRFQQVLLVTVRAALQQVSEMIVPIAKSFSFFEKHVPANMAISSGALAYLKILRHGLFFACQQLNKKLVLKSFYFSAIAEK